MSWVDTGSEPLASSFFIKKGTHTLGISALLSKSFPQELQDHTWASPLPSTPSMPQAMGPRAWPAFRFPTHSGVEGAPGTRV